MFKPTNSITVSALAVAGAVAFATLASTPASAVPVPGAAYAQTGLDTTTGKVTKAHLRRRGSRSRRSRNRRRGFRRGFRSYGFGYGHYGPPYFHASPYSYGDYGYRRGYGYRWGYGYGGYGRGFGRGPVSGGR